MLKLFLVLAVEIVVAGIVSSELSFLMPTESFYSEDSNSVQNPIEPFILGVSSLFRDALIHSQMDQAQQEGSLFQQLFPETTVNPFFSSGDVGNAVLRTNSPLRVISIRIRRVRDPSTDRQKVQVAANKPKEAVKESGNKVPPCLHAYNQYCKDKVGYLSLFACFKEHERRLEPECRKALNSEIYDCSKDAVKFCLGQDEKPDAAFQDPKEVYQCLRTNAKHLSRECRAHVDSSLKPVSDVSEAHKNVVSQVKGDQLQDKFESKALDAQQGMAKMMKNISSYFVQVSPDTGKSKVNVAAVVVASLIGAGVLAAIIFLVLRYRRKPGIEMARPSAAHEESVATQAPEGYKPMIA